LVDHGHEQTLTVETETLPLSLLACKSQGKFVKATSLSSPSAAHWDAGTAIGACLRHRESLL